MPETPRRPNARLDRPSAGGPRLRRELARAAATLELSELDTSNAHVGELLEITFAHGRDRGRPYSILELHAMAAGDLPDFSSPPGPEALKVLKRVSAKCSLRSRYRLPHHPCAQEQSGCRCLDQALDELEANRVKRKLLSLARRAHIPPLVYPGPPPRPNPTPLLQEVLAEPQDSTQSGDDDSRRPEPTPKAEPTVRVVHRTPKWFDEKPSFRDMKF